MPYKVWGRRRVPGEVDLREVPTDLLDRRPFRLDTGGPCDREAGIGGDRGEAGFAQSSRRCAAICKVHTRVGHQPPEPDLESIGQLLRRP
jgi:hypothetical protein